MQDPPEYFDRPGGFLTFDMDVPQELLKNSGPSPSSMNVQGTAGHFRLVNHQLLQASGSSSSALT
eukprot:scaffold45932_cov21-Prasinocladus_malaysianus.AAC.1